MAFELMVHGRSGLTADVVAAAMKGHRAGERRRELLWSYWRNEMTEISDGTRGVRVSQERGLPARLTRAATTPMAGPREIVVENDIAWRIGTMIDFLFGKPLRIASTAADKATAERIERVLEEVWRASGGMGLLHDTAVLGHVFGSVALVVQAADAGEAVTRATDLRVRIVPPQRGVPIASTEDYRQLDAMVIVHEGGVVGADAAGQGAGGAGPSPGGSVAERLLRVLGRTLGVGAAVSEPGAVPEAAGTMLEVISAQATQLYRVGERGEVMLVEETPALSPGQLPAVLMQNVTVPLSVGGLSEVEPLIPLQNELNTRLSDRANRVTLQCFKMYLAKGIEGFDKVPVMPGTVWYTENQLASIEAFGGDAANPSEETHIDEIREAMDKISATPPLAAGVVRSKIGNLTSENALKVTLQGILSRTARKRLTYGRGIAEICGVILGALHHAGVLETTEQERRVELLWPDPLPEQQGAAREASLAVPAAEERGFEIR